MLKSIFQVANDLSIDWQTARDWTEFGVLPMPLVVGDLLRFRQVDLDDWVAAGCPQRAELTDEQSDRLWIALLNELKKIDEQKAKG